MLSTVKFVYNNAVYNDILGNKIPSNVFGWFYLLWVVLGYNDKPDIAMLY